MIPDGVTRPATTPRPIVTIWTSQRSSGSERRVARGDRLMIRMAVGGGWVGRFHKTAD